MKSGARIALAVGFGYVIGRRRKLRTALTLAAAVAAGRASQNPGGLKQMATGLLGTSPQLGNLGKLGAPLVTAGKAAATAAAGSGIDAVSGKLCGGAAALRRRSSGRPGEQPDDGRRSAPDEEQEPDEQPSARDDEYRDDEDRAGRPAPVRRGRGR
ncbi:MULTISPECIES: hypothetical protein [unclassified Micromonospora]|uniref:hypothetical protein n=1 Tax=unclassified Micromonospora TaxID=2617518 RepID=UPI001C2354ED|nr:MULTISPECIES: hypothetical protein [unclassified Micromonospora]MBU8857377.1 hypothetical protein [Micromonospora sp. WMMB482]MDM4783001.1 hypothetical protein [Micromonospora sp. b486]